MILTYIVNLMLWGWEHGAASLVFCPDLHFSSPLALSDKSNSESYTSAQVLALSLYILSIELRSFTALK